MDYFGQITYSNLEKKLIVVQNVKKIVKNLGSLEFREREKDKQELYLGDGRDYDDNTLCRTVLKSHWSRGD